MYRIWKYIEVYMKYIDFYMTRCHNRHRDHVEGSTVLRGNNYFQVLPAYYCFVCCG